MTDLREKLRKVLVEHGMECHHTGHNNVLDGDWPRRVCPDSKRERLLDDIMREIEAPDQNDR